MGLNKFLKLILYLHRQGESEPCKEIEEFEDSLISLSSLNSYLQGAEECSVLLLIFTSLCMEKSGEIKA